MFSRLLSAASTPLTLRTPEARIAWQTLLAATGAVMTVTLGCVVPFAAMATLAARTLSPRRAITALLAAVLANQAIGFAFLGFPHTLGTAVWAPVFVVATLAAFAVSQRIAQPILALVASFTAYEGVLAAFTFATEHSLTAFAPAIVGQVALGNLIGLAVLVPVYCAIVAIERSSERGDARAAR
jgi:hypothetical protein